MSSQQVQLAVYDLSRGMASALSQQILGQRIDGIWHTGVVVYGKEYFFGGGIQAMSWGLFASSNNMPPVQVLDLGQTTKSQGELEAYLRTISHLFTQQTYDLVRNNCNNFSDTVSKFLLGGRGIPSYIVDLPQRVFSTPGGAMLRPMIDGMQNNIRAQSGYGLDPFQQPPAPAPVPATAARPTFESALSQSVTALAGNALENQATQLKLAPLEEFPLISGDSTTVQAIGTKILSLPGPDGVKGSALSAEEKEQIQIILEKLSQTSPAVISGSGKSLNTRDFTISDYMLMEKILSNHPEAHMSVLFVLRLMFLHDKVTDFNRLTIVREIVRRLLSKINEVSRPSASDTGDRPPGSEKNPFATVPAHVMALCSISNLLSHDTGKAYLLGDSSLASSEELGKNTANNANFVSELVDVALHGMNNARAEVRQMSSTLAYNLTLACTKNNALSGPWSKQANDGSENEMNSQALQLFCGCFEGILDEKDGSVRKRRLSTICRIARVFKIAAVNLMNDLGFSDILQILRTEKGLTSEEVQIIDELLHYLR
jgi:hypothetical protein